MGVVMRAGKPCTNDDTQGLCQSFGDQARTRPDCWPMYVVRLVAGVAGFALVIWTAVGAIKTVVLPRAESAFLTRWLFIGLRRLVFDPLASPKHTFAWRDRVMAMYAPVGLLLLPGVWVACTILGFSGIFWASGIQPWSEALVTSGSSLLTLGFVRPEGIGRVLVAFVEAGVGLGLVSLMISYLPTIYGAFSRRESLVGMLEVRAGSPPSATELIVRYSRIGRLDMLDDPARRTEPPVERTDRSTDVSPRRLRR